MPRPALEWICATLGGLLAAGTLAVIASDIPGSGEAVAPRLAVTAAAPEPAGEAGHLLRFTVTNSAAASAAEVEVEGRLERDGQPPEVSRARLDYVPRGSSSRGGLWFRQDPAGGRLTLRVLGYSEP